MWECCHTLRSRDGICEMGLMINFCCVIKMFYIGTSGKFHVVIMIGNVSFRRSNAKLIFSLLQLHL